MKIIFRHPTHKLCFLSCRPFVVNATFSTGLVGVEVSFISWRGQLTVGVQINDYFNCWISKCLLLLGLGLFKSLMRGEVCILGHFVLR